MNSDLPVGQRVLGLAYIDDGVAYLLGEGEVIENRVPDTSGTPVADALRLSHTPVPAVKLDTGEIAYAFEAWWMPVEMTDYRLGPLGRAAVKLSVLREAAAAGRTLLRTA